MAASAVRLLLLLLLAFHVVLAAGNRVRGVEWLEEKRSALVRLDIPNLPLWNPIEQIGEDVPTALVLNFTLTHDRHSLLVQGEPFLPLPNPHLPPRLAASQVSQTVTDVEDSPLFDLDYFRLVYPREDPAIRYSNYAPTLTLNLLGAGIAGYNTLLRDPEQRAVRITLKDRHSGEASRSLEPIFDISDVKLIQRAPYYKWVGPEEIKACTLRSWRCPDFDHPPWYQYIYRVNFDEYGRIGSLRHEVLQRWDTLCDRFGFWRATVVTFAFASIMFSPLIYAAYKGLCSLNEYRKAQGESKASQDIDEEEAEGLLDEDEERSNDYPPAFSEEEESVVEKEMDENQIEEKQSEAG